MQILPLRAQDIYFVPGVVLDQENIIEPTPTLVLALWYRSVLGQRPSGHPYLG